jgi:hypothetical protein
MSKPTLRRSAAPIAGNVVSLTDYRRERGIPLPGEPKGDLLQSILELTEYVRALRAERAATVVMPFSRVDRGRAVPDMPVGGAA